MADTNLFDQGLESPPVTKTTPTASGNLFDQGLTGGGGVSPSVPESPSSSVSSNLFDAGLGSPNNGQPVPAPSAQDENQPWYKKAFDWTNTPTVDFVHLMGPEGAVGKAFGRTEEPKGIERGVENIVSGFTAPLSIALTLGTFGTGGLLESAGATALKEAGGEFAENLPQIMKAAQTAVDTYKAAPEGATAIADAVKAAGVDPALWNRAQKFLYDNGLTEHDLLGGDLIDRGTFQILRKTAPGWSIATTARAAETAKSIMSAGFTFQQLESASAMSPRFLDALKEGDTDKAWEYGTEMFASGTLGILGASHALHSAGELFKPLIENDAFRPNDQWLAIDRANKEREAQHAEAEQEAINLDKSAREILGHSTPGFLESVFGGSKEATAQKNLELATVFHQIVTGGDRVKAAQWYNALSEALGREERLPVPGESGPNNGQLPPAQGGLGPTTGQLPPFSQEPVLGKPTEPPTKDGTKVVHSNDAGEVRVGADGRPVVWLTPDAWDAFRKSNKLPPIKGASFPPADAEEISSNLSRNEQIQNLFDTARRTSQQGLLTANRNNVDVQVASEELHHTWQRELSQDGEIANLFKPGQWKNLYGIIPRDWQLKMDEEGYHEDPVVRVAETAAQFRSGKAQGIVPDTDIVRFLDAFYTEIEANHGKNAVEASDKINEIAAQHIKDINENRRERSATEASELANKDADRRKLSSMEARRQAGSSEVGSGEPQTGLSSKENEEFTPPLSRPNNGLFAKDRDNLAPTWYLKSNQLIDSRMSGPMPADTVLKMLENNGVKPDELKYTGLADLLREKGQEKVSPDELKKFLDANNLQIQEVTRLPVSDEEMSRRIASGEGNVSGKPTRFGSYTLPGGSNYREMLLTLPENGNTPIPKIKNFTVYDGNGEAIAQGTGEPSDRTRANLLAHPEYRIEYGEQNDPRSIRNDTSNFRSSHWDEPNVVGHVRFNDRTGPNGEKLLHLEELQSDWHQKGRDVGYKRSEDRPHDVDELSQQILDAQRAGDRPAMDQLMRERARVLSGVPDAPFKKTDEWTGLLFKRMIRYAAEHGYDGISWTPGVEHFNRWGSERFDWEKQGDGKWSVSGKSQHGGNAGGIDLEGEADRRGLLTKSGEDVRNQGDLRRIVHRTMEATSSKEKIDALTKKLWDRMQSEDSGTSMPRKEGFESYYDQITPQVANKLGKQFGAKVGETEIPDENKAASKNLKGAPAYTGPGGFNELVKLSDTHPELREPIKQVLDAHLQRRENLDVSIARYGGDSLAKALGGKIKQPDSLPKLKVPYFPITDSMRESVMKQGQPLFAKESPNNGQDPQLAHQIDTNVFKNQPKDYQDLVMESLRRNAAGELSDREIAASKKLREEDGRNYEIGSANDLIHTFLENHLHRIYEEDNPKGKVILSNAKAGKFATNVSQARQQVYDSQLTALLKSPKKIMLDPIKAVSMDRGDLIKAAANRQLIDNLRDKFTRASDGRPAVVLSGSGQVVSGQNGEDPSIFVDPNRVRKINIDPKVIQQMSTSGDLDKYLADGTIRDITPYVRPNNIGAAIDRLEEQATKSTPAPDEHGQNPLRTQIMLLKSMQANGDFSGLKDFNDALEKKYAWDPQDYVSLANNAMKGWNFITNSPDGTPVYVRSDIKVHPEFAEYLQNRLGLKESDISKNPVGKALLGAGTKLKQTLLSLSPFHLVQEALRGIMVGVNPFHITGPDILSGEKVDPSDPNSPTIIRKLVENNFTTGTDYKAQQSSSEGLSSGGGLLNKAPGVGKVIGNSLNWYQDFLFKRYIPALKARAGELLFHEYQRLHPDWSVDRVAKAAATHANDTFGGINWKAMGRSATTQDWGRLMFLAPDWLESEMRSGARLFNKDEGGLGRAQVAKMALGLWGIARVLNLVTTGNAHYEAPFGLATKNKEGKETVFSIRTLPTDLLHAASDPVGFIKGRLSPTVRTGEELVSGRDQYGRKLQPSDLWVDVFRNMSPIPLQAVGQAISGTGPEIGNIGQAVKAVGGTAQTYQTPAQKLAADLASSHTESGPIDPAQMAKHSRVIQLEDQARAGEISWPDLYKLAYQTDQISEKELKTIQENVKATHGLPSDMASLYTRAARLPAKEFLDLWDVTNPSERAALAPLVSKVQKRYLAKAKKEMTPDERAKDPVFQRLVRMIPPNPMQPSS